MKELLSLEREKYKAACQSTQHGNGKEPKPWAPITLLMRTGTKQLKVTRNKH